MVVLHHGSSMSQDRITTLEKVERTAIKGSKFYSKLICGPMLESFNVFEEQSCLCQRSINSAFLLPQRHYTNGGIEVDTFPKILQQDIKAAHVFTVRCVLGISGAHCWKTTLVLKLYVYIYFSLISLPYGSACETSHVS